MILKRCTQYNVVDNWLGKISLIKSKKTNTTIVQFVFLPKLPMLKKLIKLTFNKKIKEFLFKKNPNNQL